MYHLLSFHWIRKSPLNGGRLRGLLTNSEKRQRSFKYDSVSNCFIEQKFQIM